MFRADLLNNYHERRRLNKSVDKLKNIRAKEFLTKQVVIDELKEQLKQAQSNMSHKDHANNQLVCHVSVFLFGLHPLFFF